MASTQLRRYPQLRLVACLALIARGQRLTFNGCSCKKDWKDTAGAQCDDYCCNPGGGIFWCEVEDVACEDATWGWCLENGEQRPATRPVANCQDHPWHDLDGDGCLAYSVNQWCSQDGKVGQGWHEEWGNLALFRANGNTAFEACCACGGGNKGGAGATGAAPAHRWTYGGCKCRNGWEVQGMKCEHECCNPDGESAGQWCQVEDESCESSQWGYCRPEGEVLSEVGRTGDKHGHCTDVAGWQDLDHESCDTYASKAYCTDVGGYGMGWSLDWGNFAQFVATNVQAANQACCACGGGTRDDGFEPGAGTEFALGVDAKVRSTLQGCSCKKDWAMIEVGACTDYCCNPDADAIGTWCMVADAACEESDWGYCRESGLGFLEGTSMGGSQGPLQDAVHCQDAPAWKDKDGDGCGMYSAAMWCTSESKTGPGWHEEWGSVPSGAYTACCACGGGRIAKEEEQDMTTVLLKTAEDLYKGEEADHMWWVASGPCKMDEHGCITSGNFPGAYGANEVCQIGVYPEKAKPILVKFFETERRYDVLKVNGQTYSGNRAPNGIIPESTIHWGADSKDQRGGWMLCARGQVPKKNPSAIALKVFGAALVVVVCGCCGAFAGLWIRTYRNMAHGDGLGAGPTKTIGKYAAQQDA